MIPSAPLVRAAVRLLGVVPAAPVRALARTAGAVGFVVARGRRRTLLDNQRFLQPAASPTQRRRAARHTMMNLAEAAVDLYRLPTMGAGEMSTLVEVRGREHMDAALAMGRGVIAVTAHLGPYELAGAWLALAGYPVHAMVEELDPQTNAALALYREATGMKLLSRNAGIRPVLRLLKEGQIVVLVADRVVGDGTEGIAVPFAGGERRIPTGPATLALSTGAPLIIGHIARNQTGATRYIVEMEPPVVASRTGDGPRDRDRLTRRIASSLASAVQSHPDQWYVFQPEWARRDASPRN
ncbi:MAG: lysophospholipid acyltransferase family protein [Gemmatimonadaceae bacterium]|nr:lysophospholipid acyltransferase family protein [Gemmatimonadaceae bacterium]